MSLKKNLIANLVGQIWVAVMGIAFIPIYIRVLGAESFGLIALHTVLQASLNLFTAGLTPALGREMARYTARKHDHKSIRNLLFSVEIVLILLAIIFICSIIAISDWMSENYLADTEIDAAIISNVFIILAFVASFRMIEGIYRSTLVGLQRQLNFNVINCALALCRGVFGAISIIFLSPTIIVFFSSQLIVGIIAVIILRYAALRALPQIVYLPRFDIKALKKIAKYAGGTFLISLSVLLISQTDKAILPALTTMKNFAFYTVAATAAASLSLISAPVAQAFQPRMVQLIETGRTAKLRELFHVSSQLMSVLTGSISIIIFLYAKWILSIWLGDSDIVHEATPILKLLIIGTFFNCMLVMPYILQLAHGWTSLTVYINFAIAAITVPSLVYFVPRYGINASAIIWLLLNIGVFIVAPQILYRYILQSEKYKWYFFDIFIPTFTSFIICFAFYEWMFVDLQNNFFIGLSAIFLLLTSIISSSLASTQLLRLVREKISII